MLQNYGFRVGAKEDSLIIGERLCTTYLLAITLFERQDAWYEAYVCFMRIRDYKLLDRARMDARQFLTMFDINQPLNFIKNGCYCKWCQYRNVRPEESFNPRPASGWCNNLCFTLYEYGRFRLAILAEKEAGL